MLFATVLVLPLEDVTALTFYIGAKFGSSE
jgi:hypothetical protein